MQYQIKREDSSYSEYKNAEFIPAFLMIPKELLIRCGMEMFMLPRTRAGLFADPGTIRKVESNLFRECVIDVYAYMAWPHMGLKGRLEDYSGYNPCWAVAHAAPDQRAVHLLIERVEVSSDQEKTDVNVVSTLTSVGDMN